SDCPAARGGSFSSCRRSLTRAQPGPGRNVPRSVHVSIDHAMNRTYDDLLPRAVASSPQRWQPVLVPAGFTCTTRRRASAALPVRMLVNWAQPASRIDLFSPALARAWLARNLPGFSESGLGAGRLVIPAVFRSSSAITSHWLMKARAVLWW